MDSTSFGFDTKAVNNWLTGIYLLELEEKASMSGWSAQQEYYAWITLDNIFLNEEYLSFSWNTAGYMNQYFAFEKGFTFHLKTGKEIALNELVWFGKGKPITEEDDNYSTYCSDTLAPAIVKMLKSLYPDSIKAAKDDGCDYSEAFGWDNPTWRLTPKGIYLGFFTGSSNLPCNYAEWTVWPYDRLRPFQNRYSNLKLP